MLFGNCSQFDIRARLHVKLLSAGCSSCAAFMPQRLLPCLQMEAELMKLNQEALKQLVEKETPVKVYIAGVHKTLLKGYEGVLGDKPSQHESLFSLRAVGCFQSGLHQQVCPQLLPKYSTFALHFATRVCCRYCCPPCCIQILQSGEHFASGLSGLWENRIVCENEGFCCLITAATLVYLLPLHLILCEGVLCEVCEGIL